MESVPAAGKSPRACSYSVNCIGSSRSFSIVGETRSFKEYIVCSFPLYEVVSAQSQSPTWRSTEVTGPEGFRSPAVSRDGRGQQNSICASAAESLASKYWTIRKPGDFFGHNIPHCAWLCTLINPMTTFATQLELNLRTGILFINE